METNKLYELLLELPLLSVTDVKIGLMDEFSGRQQKSFAKLKKYSFAKWKQTSYTSFF